MWRQSIRMIALSAQGRWSRLRAAPAWMGAPGNFRPRLACCTQRCSSTYPPHRLTVGPTRLQTMCRAQAE